MSSSSSKPAAPPPTNRQLMLDESANIPPDPGNSSHNPLTISPVSSNNHANPQNGNQPVSFRQVLHYWRGTDVRNHNITSPTPPQIWFAQNVYPLVTPMRIIWFCLSQLSFLLAYGFFMETELYKTCVGSGGHHHARPLLFFVAANIGHNVWLIFLLFFSFFCVAYERYLHHYLLKSLGELVVMLSMSLLILGIGHKHQDGSSEVAGLATCAFLTFDALCVINLLKPGHHYSLLEATATLTLHLGLVGRMYLSIPAVLFVFVILVIKNFLWRHIGQAQAPISERHQLVWFAYNVVDNFSSV